ncbi:two-component system QseEF-associated lipoprotein QseG [Rouxiella badensis]|uniref:two-component system QseEF-associated lipoprotein QseG n=1 Tax=Rouxiella badensis TaxID=1646377 RepID=UPI0022AAA394|nr:two-component system QseEF-associated lipoprotein QseG [Rouxiella badensis]WAT09185.1 two-component system QseEF-associated lipoprotein QseG [Rouxiella badensis]
MQTRFLSFFSRLGLIFTSALLTPMLLSGCARHQSDGLYQPIEDVIPDSKVVDFRIAPCETLWALDDSATLTNSLYWLRAMDCSERMSTAQANYQAAQIPSSGWANIFKQSILAAGNDPDVAQRRTLLNNVNDYRAEMPSAVRPLLQLWRERQSLQIAFEDEKARNARQQTSNEAKIEEMSNQQKLLEASLGDTRRKLENLTDIERQLSSRKQLQGELPDSDGAPSSTSTSGSRSVTGGNVQAKDTYVPPKTNQFK